MKKVVLYYADWCGHCKTFKPMWEKIKHELKDKAEFANYDDKSDETRTAGVSGFPTIKIDNKDYNGPRTFEAIKQAILSPQNGGNNDYPAWLMEGGADYHRKYLKYKMKYLNAKNKN